MNTTTEVARRFYRALSDGDGHALFDLLTADFEGIVSAGMPYGVGGQHHGRVAMIANVWGRIDAVCDVEVAPVEYLPVTGGGRVVVLGTYRGSVRTGRCGSRCGLRARHHRGKRADNSAATDHRHRQVAHTCLTG